MMEREMAELGYSADRLPLDKLGDATIARGYSALNKISAVLTAAATHLIGPASLRRSPGQCG